MENQFNLSFSECKRLINEGIDLRDFVDSVNDQPAWLLEMGGIEELDELLAIRQGGCASGAFMPAVTYRTAMRIMGVYGDEIMEYVEDQLSEITLPSGESWSGLAVYMVSRAVELWCGQFDLDPIDW